MTDYAGTLCVRFQGTRWKFDCDQRRDEKLFARGEIDVGENVFAGN